MVQAITHNLGRVSKFVDCVLVMGVGSGMEKWNLPGIMLRGRVSAVMQWVTSTSASTVVDLKALGPEAEQANDQITLRYY